MLSFPYHCAMKAYQTQVHAKKLSHGFGANSNVIGIFMMWYVFCFGIDGRSEYNCVQNIIEDKLAAARRELKQILPAVPPSTPATGHSRLELP